MQIAIVTRFKNAIKPSLLAKYNLKISKKPEAVVCIGGEGTLLWGELVWPGLPKLFVKHKCRPGCRHNFDPILQKLASKKFSIRKMLKLEAIVNGNRTKKLIGLNEINIHYKMPCAIGLNLTIGGRRFRDVMGDGVIIATPYGSTAYYYSIARKTFSKGIGIAFNNPIKRIRPIVVPEKSIIKATMTKGRGWLATDCNPRLVSLKIGDRITIKAHPKPARIIKLAGYPLKVCLQK